MKLHYLLLGLLLTVQSFAFQLEPGINLNIYKAPYYEVDNINFENELFTDVALSLSLLISDFSIRYAYGFEFTESYNEDNMIEQLGGNVEIIGTDYQYSSHVIDIAYSFFINEQFSISPIFGYTDSSFSYPVEVLYLNDNMLSPDIIKYKLDNNEVHFGLEFRYTDRASERIILEYICSIYLKRYFNLNITEGYQMKSGIFVIRDDLSDFFKPVVALLLESSDPYSIHPFVITLFAGCRFIF